MKVFAIGDLHLSGEPEAKPMDIFDKAWSGHWDKVSSNWQETVLPDDLVLIAGDTSWALNLQEAMFDLNRIAALPGHKIIVRGNHDYWWSTVGKMRKVFAERLLFLQNNFYAFGSIAVCGTRGWEFPIAGNEYYTEADEKIFIRELLRIENSLQQADMAGYKDKILLLHYPPLLADGNVGAITELCTRYGVKKCLYGHLHGAAHQLAYNGRYCGTEYQLVSADFVQFKLLQVLEV